MIGGHAIRPVRTNLGMADRVINGLRVSTEQIRSVSNKRGNKGIKVIKFKNGTELEVPYQSKSRQASVEANYHALNHPTFIQNAVGVKAKTPANARWYDIEVRDSSIKNIEINATGTADIQRCRGSKGAGKVSSESMIVFDSKNLSVDAPEGASGRLICCPSHPNENVTIGNNIKETIDV